MESGAKMAVPVRHAICGGIVMWYIGDPGEARARSADVRYLDGTRPAPCSVFPQCPHCCFETNSTSLKRCFHEDIDPGFEITRPLNYDH